ncbi:glycosyltransferase family 2 protein [Taibaiella koreensis]|uniref:glycosyltransferase family 2 protein n=1 Tax=Taibaiella koreensis TaxID=1268548 RepID=UPI000E59A895|nr:glycosyltransferase family 2 protein [Taibaiella koreensis]
MPSEQNIPTPVSLCIVSNQLNSLLERIVKAASGWFSEILIGYDGKAEAVPESFLSAAPNLRLVPVSWEGFSATKNKLAALAAYPWILSLDSDELPDDQLFRSIAALPFAGLPKEHIYTFRRLSYFEGKKIVHGAWGRDRVIRLYHRETTAWDNAIVHEALILHPGMKLQLLEGTLLHYTADDYATFLEKNRRYARLSAEKYFQKGKKSPVWKRIGSPLFTFIREYLFLGGFLDGAAGCRVARINMLYTRWKYAYLAEMYQERSSS